MGEGPEPDKDPFHWRDLNITTYIPGGGKIFYWREGGGASSMNERQRKEFEKGWKEDPGQFEGYEVEQYLYWLDYALDRGIITESVHQKKFEKILGE